MVGDQLATTNPDLKVFEGLELHGNVNVDEEGLLRNISSAIRRGHPQVKPMPLQNERICLVGGGPSLNNTLEELRDLVFEGALIVALNNAVEWCVEHNLRPSAQVIVDARPTNARFIHIVPRMRYLIASQCDPAVWNRLVGVPNVWIWHSVDPTESAKRMLDEYYLERWQPIAGGTTSAMRALALFRTLGYVRYDLFGIDSCWMGDAHHAYSQVENQNDHRFTFNAYPLDHPEMDRAFKCAPWHVKQAEDFLQLLRLASDQFVMNVHGDGLLAHLLQCAANLLDLEINITAEGSSE